VVSYVGYRVNGAAEANMNLTHILMPYSGTSADRELLKALCAIGRAVRARISVVCVVEVPMSLPVDAESAPGLDEGNVVLDEAEEVAAQVGGRISTVLLQARDAGHAIVEEAESCGADLIVMEARLEQGSGVVDLGRRCDYVLRHAHCPVWISRQMPPEQRDAKGLLEDRQ
jgi:nucleotide-binding universal stress UspA family protein